MQFITLCICTKTSCEKNHSKLEIRSEKWIKNEEEKIIKGGKRKIKHEKGRGAKKIKLADVNQQDDQKNLCPAHSVSPKKATVVLKSSTRLRNQKKTQVIS